MKFEFEVFDSVDELLAVAASGFSMGMRQLSVLTLYGDSVLFYSPTLSGEKNESVWVITLAKGTLPLGLIEFDYETKKVEKTSRAVNPEKSHFLVVKPVRSTILDEALQEFSRL